MRICILILTLLVVLMDAKVQAKQPAAIWDLPARDRHLLVAELDSGKLFVFKKHPGLVLEQVAEYPISIGKQGYFKRVEGDAKTPVGVYRITSRLNDKQLDDFYGRAAFPLNYPNAWDRLNGYTGSGIWLHGEPTDTKSRPLRDSDGCVVLSNNDIVAVQNYLDVGYTKVITVPTINWQESDYVASNRRELTAAMDAWREAWQSRNHKAYLSFYSEKFSDTEKNYRQWDRYKRRVNGAKRYIKLKFSDVGLYAYPSEEGLVMADFYQDYRSNNFNSAGWKRQIWKKEDGQWKILYERGG